MEETMQKAIESATRIKGVEKPVASAEDRQIGTHNPRNDFISQIAGQTEHDQLLGEMTDDQTLTGVPAEIREGDDGAQTITTDGTPEQAEPETLELEGDAKRVADPDKTETQTTSEDEFLALDQFKGKKIRLKVDGEDRVLTLDDALREVQKQGAADRRLQEATRNLNESKALYERATASTQSSTQDAAATQSQQQPSLDPDVAAMVQALRTGTDDEALAAGQLWERHLRERATPTDAVVRAFVNDQFDFRSSADWCKSEYQDLFADPVLANMFADRDAREVVDADKGLTPRRPYRERYKAIGDDLRGWVSKFGKSTAQPTQTLESKREKKAAVILPPAASVKDAAPSVDDATEDDVQDVIANIAKARGQNMRSA